MSLIEDLKSTSDQSFDKWFDRWFEKNDFPNTFKKSAQLPGISIEFTKVQKTNLLNLKYTVEKLEFSWK